MYPKLFGVIDMYPICWVIGFLCGYLFLELYFRRFKFDKGASITIELMGLASIAMGIVTGLLFENLYEFIDNPNAYHWSWNMTFFGGLIGGVLMFLALYYFYAKKKYGPFLKDVSIIAPSVIAICHAWGRVGCFFNGCCYGIETDSFLGVSFPGFEHPVLPINLWEAIFLFVLAAILFFIAYYKKTPYCFVVYMISYGVFRFLIEYLRGDNRGSFIPGISPSQFWAILLVAGGIAYLSFLLYKKFRPNEEKSE